MTLALICSSHSPLMGDEGCSVEVQHDLDRAFNELAEFVRSFRPELIVQFSPDHFNGFFYDLMPMFCLGIEATSIGDWKTTPGPLDVPREDAAELAEALISNGFDMATSRRMQVDHGFVQIWERLTPNGVRGLPIVPIFVNCSAPPLPTMKRVRELGEAVGRLMAASERRVLIVASGGLSHDPPVPSIATGSPEVVEKLIANRNPSPEARREREERVRAAGRTALSGSPEILPVSEVWDRAFLDQLRFGDPHALDALSTTDIVRDAGRGGLEVLCWAAAMAALRAAGPVKTQLHAYHAIQGWIVGMALLSGQTKGS